MNLSQRIAELPPDRFAKGAHASARLAIRAAELAGKQPPESAVWLLSQSIEQLAEHRRKRLLEEKPVNKYIELFNKVNKLLDYKNDPIGVTAWWSETNGWFGWWNGEQLSPLTILANHVPSLMSEEEFIKCVELDIEDCSRGMD